MATKEIKGIAVKKEKLTDNSPISWVKKCPCCNEIHDKVKKEYSKNDMRGNAVQFDEKGFSAKGGVMFQLCGDCMVLYTPWVTL